MTEITATRGGETEVDIATEPNAAARADALDGGDQLESAVRAPEEPAKDRLLLPLLVPFLAIVAVALYALNVSRVFLAGDSTSALVIATLITIMILAGSAIISASPRLRTSSLAMVMGFVLVILVSAGLLSLGPSLKSGRGGTGGALAQPTGPAGSTVHVAALASIKFDSTQYTAKAGVVKFDYSGAPGHTLQFRILNYQGFPLKSSGSPGTGKVKLKAGTYQIYCTVAGHAARGMVATIAVNP